MDAIGYIVAMKPTLRLKSFESVGTTRMEAKVVDESSRREQMLEETLGLIRRVRLRSSAPGDGPLAGMGLTTIQHTTLHFAMRNPGSIQRQLARFLGVPSGHVTAVVDTLERQGLIRRVPDPVDRRINRLEATPRAVELHQRIHELAGESLHPLFRRWSDDEIESLYSLMKRFAEEDGLPPAVEYTRAIRRQYRETPNAESAGETN
jgi:DNA-binding MarR family transcriptional regulator